jgi:hypothetical protein
MKKRVRWQACDVFTSHKDLTRRWWKNARYHIEKCCFSGSVWADQPGDRSGLDLERRTVNRAETAEMAVQVFNLDHRISLWRGFDPAFYTETARENSRAAWCCVP